MSVTYFSLTSSKPHPSLFSSPFFRATFSQTRLYTPLLQQIRLGSLPHNFASSPFLQDTPFFLSYREQSIIPLIPENLLESLEPSVLQQCSSAVLLAACLAGRVSFLVHCASWQARPADSPPLALLVSFTLWCILVVARVPLTFYKQPPGTLVALLWGSFPSFLLLNVELWGWRENFVSLKPVVIRPQASN